MAKNSLQATLTRIANAPTSAPVSDAPIVSDAPVSDAPVSTFGDDGTLAAYYASMSRKDSRTYAAAALPMMSPAQIAEVAGIVAGWERAESDTRNVSRLAKLLRAGADAGKAYGLLGSVAAFAANTANLSFVGHGRMGYTLLADVAACESHPAGTVKVVFTPTLLPNAAGLPVPNMGHDAPVKVAPVKVAPDAV